MYYIGLINMWQVQLTNKRKTSGVFLLQYLIMVKIIMLWQWATQNLIYSVFVIKCKRVLLYFNIFNIHVLRLFWLFNFRKIFKNCSLNKTSMLRFLFFKFIALRHSSLNLHRCFIHFCLYLLLLPSKRN